MASKRAANRVEIVVRHRLGKAHARRLVLAARRYLRALRIEGHELSLALVKDDEIQAINRAWRRKDKPTDVLSFPAERLPPGSPGLQPLGDVIISLDTARRQAREESRSLESELARYLAHGVLHLLGHDHHRREDAARMAAAEERLLGASGMVPRPGAAVRAR